MNVDLNAPPNCQFLKYAFSSFGMEKSKAKKASLSIEFKDFQVHQDNHDQYLVDFNLRHDNTKVAVHFAICGEFSFAGGITEKNAFFAWTNGATILYGIARATVMQITSQSLFPSLLLPTLMMDDLIRKHVAAGQKKSRKKTPSKS